MNIAKDIINQQIKKQGITLAELSRRAEIPYIAVHKTLKGGRRMSGGEFLAYCHALGINRI